jgi:hypothetical protein
MKIFLFLLWLLPTACLAQTDSAKVKPHDVYCRIFIVPVTFSSRISVKYDFGEKSGKLYLPENEFNKLTKDLAEIDSEIDALNYLAMQGWEVVTFNQLREAPNSYLLRKKVQ